MLQLESIFIFLTPYDVGCRRGSLIILRMKTKITTAQLELTLPNHRACRSLSRPRQRSTRAAFWFQRMRQIVEAAADWPTLPGSRPQKASD